MLKKTITYTDYNGVERTEDFYFNLSRAELAEMQLMTEGGLAEKIQKISQSNDVPAITKIFKEIILKAYGEKSEDGKRFVKNAEIREAFEQTEAYSELFMAFMTDENAAADFINGLIPDSIKNTPEYKQAMAEK